jgi:hypothetical protein
LFGLLHIRVPNADVLVTPMLLRSPTWSAGIREHCDDLYVKEQRRIVANNCLESGVPDADNHEEMPIMKDDDTTGTEHIRLQKITNAVSFIA